MNLSTEQLFTAARTHNGWRDRPVEDDTLRQLYDLMKWGPTSANSSPARLVFVRSTAAKDELLGCVSPGNVAKVRDAPVTVIVGMDMAFHEQLPKLFPHVDARAWFAGNAPKIAETAMRNSSLQGGYLILAARALGLDCGPMSGFDHAKVDAAFWTGTTVRTNFLCALGHGDAAKLLARSPRLDFDEACRFRLKPMPEWLAAWPFIADPTFYLVAVPAVLLMGLGKSGFLSGFGALATPLLSLVVPVPQAAAIMLPLLLVMDVTGLQQLWRERDRALLRRLMPAGLLGIVIGTLLFGVLSAKAVAGLVGVLTLLFLAQRLLFPATADAPTVPHWVGFCLAATSGFTSFVVHAGSPPLNAYLLPLRLRPITYAGTAAVFFAAVNLAKWLPYAWLGLLDRANLATSALLLPLAPLGVWLGVFLARRIDSRWFYRVAYTGMFATGAKLLWDGLR